VAPYILDFYCQEAKVAVELDGGQHADKHRTNLDEGRRCDLEGRGIRVLRFWNHDVLQNTEAVLQAIWEALPSAYPHPDPLPEGEGEEA
jgi:very-short-patch-repair endonuclease